MARTAERRTNHLFVVERYMPDATLDRLIRGELAAASAFVGLRGVSVRHRESIWLPEDETVLSTFLAASGEELERALRARGIPGDRIVGAVRFVSGIRPATDHRELDA